MEIPDSIYCLELFLRGINLKKQIKDHLLTTLVIILGIPIAVIILLLYIASYGTIVVISITYGLIKSVKNSKEDRNEY